MSLTDAAASDLAYIVEWALSPGYYPSADEDAEARAALAELTRRAEQLETSARYMERATPPLSGRVLCGGASGAPQGSAGSGE